MAIIICIHIAAFSMYARMIAKIHTSYQQLDACCDELDKLQSAGVVNGYTDELLGCVCIFNPAHVRYICILHGLSRTLRMEREIDVALGKCRRLCSGCYTVMIACLP